MYGYTMYTKFHKIERFGAHLIIVINNPLLMNGSGTRGNDIYTY